jgi:hypothetical protein
LIQEKIALEMERNRLIQEKIVLEMKRDRLMQEKKALQDALQIKTKDL